MFGPMLSFGLIALATAWIVLGVMAIGRLRVGRVTDAPCDAPPITVLKPLCGADAGLEANLRSFFDQRYPRFQLLFGVEGPHDPAIEVVDRLASQYPNVDCTLMLHSGSGAKNPKVSN